MFWKKQKATGILLLSLNNIPSMKKMTLLFNILYFFGVLNAQEHALFFGFDLPIQYTAGYQIQFNQTSTQIHLGAISKPFDNYTIKTIEKFGANEDLVEVIENSFKKGWSFTIKENFKIKKSYLGIYGQYINLKASDLPLDLLQNYLNIDLSSNWPTIPIILPLLDYGNETTRIELNSNLFQFGFLYGRQFSLRNPKFAIKTEFSISKNIYTKNSFSSISPYPRSIYDTLDEDIKEAFRAYAYIPSLNIYFVYRLGGS